jgi:integrase
VLHDAGGLTYDHVEDEFRQLAGRLGWPPAATVKDLRHLFATAMNNANQPEAYRQYLMGHGPGRAAIGAYTHLTEVGGHYAAAVRKVWTPVIEAVIAGLANDPAARAA